MQRYFGTVKDGIVTMDEASRHHLYDVMRAKPGEKFTLVDSGKVYLCLINNDFSIRVESEEEENHEIDGKLIIAFSLLKGDHGELIVLKGTEIGVNEFVPYISERTIIRPDGREDKKLLRLRKIAQEGAAQCKRSFIPEVDGYRDFRSVLNMEADRKIIAYEGEAGKGKSLLESLSDIAKGESVLILIGPEGGYSPKEASLAKESGFEFVSLGRRILRAETAAIYAASIASSLMEK